jgi:GTP pyrophosphokinase
LPALAVETTKLVRVQRLSRAQSVGQLVDDPKAQTENVRKMLLAFSRDLRVVMLRLASRLQTLRYTRPARQPVPPGVARESLQVFAPLANRLGIWQIKWEMEDLPFASWSPTPTARWPACWTKSAPSAKRCGAAAPDAGGRAARAGHRATVQGRPKHIYSIVRKMRGKSLDFDQVFDIRALRVVVPTVKDCYAALSWVHRASRRSWNEFDDYIAPKPNGYQSLHTVVRDAAGSRSRSRSARRPCTTMPSTAWRRTGPTRRPAPRATRA